MTTVEKPKKTSIWGQPLYEHKIKINNYLEKKLLKKGLDNPLNENLNYLIKKYENDKKLFISEYNKYLLELDNFYLKQLNDYVSNISLHPNISHNIHSDKLRHDGYLGSNYLLIEQKIRTYKAIHWTLMEKGYLHQRSKKVLEGIKLIKEPIKWKLEKFNKKEIIQEIKEKYYSYIFNC